ncbi:MAG: hypothetical protein Q8P50_14905 [Bacillota bacterium]|nr:hypothetical protein [Bacillota bacterium]
MAERVEMRFDRYYMFDEMTEAMRGLERAWRSSIPQERVTRAETSGCSR